MTRNTRRLASTVRERRPTSRSPQPLRGHVPRRAKDEAEIFALGSRTGSRMAPLVAGKRPSYTRKCGPREQVKLVQAGVEGVDSALDGARAK